MITKSIADKFITLYGYRPPIQLPNTNLATDTYYITKYQFGFPITNLITDQVLATGFGYLLLKQILYWWIAYQYEYQFGHWILIYFPITIWFQNTDLVTKYHFGYWL